MDTVRIWRFLATLGVLAVTAALAVSFFGIVAAVAGILGPVLQSPNTAEAETPASEGTQAATPPEMMTLATDLPRCTPARLAAEYPSPARDIVQKRALSEGFQKR